MRAVRTRPSGAFTRLGHVGASVEDETAQVNVFRPVAVARLAAAQSRASDHPAVLETLGRLAGLRSEAFARQLQVDHAELSAGIDALAGQTQFFAGPQYLLDVNRIVSPPNTQHVRLPGIAQFAQRSIDEAA